MAPCGGRAWLRGESCGVGRSPTGGSTRSPEREPDGHSMRASYKATGKPAGWVRDQRGSLVPALPGAAERPRVVDLQDLRRDPQLWGDHHRAHRADPGGPPASGDQADQVDAAHAAGAAEGEGGSADVRGTQAETAGRGDGAVQA